MRASSPYHHGPQPVTAQLDACALITAEEIEEVMGWRPGSPDDSPGATSATCRWTAEGGAVRSVDVMISVARLPSYEVLEGNIRESGGATLPGVKRVDVGDFAAWGGTDRFGMLQMVSSGRLVNVSTTGEGGERETATAIARKVVPRVR